MIITGMLLGGLVLSQYLQHNDISDIKQIDARQNAAISQNASDINLVGSSFADYINASKGRLDPVPSQGDWRGKLRNAEWLPKGDGRP